MQHLIEEYNRLTGVGPSLTEKASADPMLGVLAKAFSVKAVKPADVKFLRYRKVGKGVELEDKASRLGGILTSVEPRDADPGDLLAFLKSHGAKPAPKVEALDESVARTILKQMGGSGRLKAMIGAKHFIDHGQSLSFQFPNRKRSKGNYVKITLRGDDTYDMEFSVISGGGTKVKKVKTYSGIYFDQLQPLFTEWTGLRLRL